MTAATIRRNVAAFASTYSCKAMIDDQHTSLVGRSVHGLADGIFIGDGPFSEGKAYVVAEKAHCLYEPHRESAIRCTPPLGTEIAVIREEGDWFLVKVFGKKAWSHKHNISQHPGEIRETELVGTEPEFNRDYSASKIIEYGPRGGRFVRSHSGFKRYL